MVVALWQVGKEDLLDLPICTHGTVRLYRPVIERCAVLELIEVGELTHEKALQCGTPFKLAPAYYNSCGSYLWRMLTFLTSRSQAIAYVDKQALASLYGNVLRRHAAGTKSLCTASCTSCTHMCTIAIVTSYTNQFQTRGHRQHSRLLGSTDGAYSTVNPANQMSFTQLSKPQDGWESTANLIKSLF